MYLTVILTQKCGERYMNNRDDFSQKTKHLIANRAGVRCSNPDCRKPTSGANSNPDKITNIGVAAHICAAAEGGPRYDVSMTPNQRKSSRNGIWLCQSCAKMIDSDEMRYTKEILHSWKRLAEALSTVELEKPSILQSSSLSHPIHSLETLEEHWFQKPAEKASVKWGYRSLDDIYILSPGTLVLLAGYSDTDVSIVAQNITRFNMKAHCNIIYFNLKESSNSITNKLLAAESAVETEVIRIGKLREDEWQRVACATAIFKDSNLLFESYNVTRDMSDYLLSAINYGHADMVVIDDFAGLGLDEKSLSSFLYKLRCVASDSNTTVLMVLDLLEKPSRVDKRPIISDSQIRGFCKFCDVVQFLYFDEYSNFSIKSDSIELELITAKYFTSHRGTTTHLKELPRYATILEHEKQSEPKKVFSEKYPGLIAGAKLLAEYLENI